MAGTRDAEIAALLEGLAVPGGRGQRDWTIAESGGAMSEMHAESSTESPWGQKKCFKVKEMLERAAGGAGERAFPKERRGIHSDRWASPPDSGLPVGIYTSIGIPSGSDLQSWKPHLPLGHVIRTHQEPSGASGLAVVVAGRGRVGTDHSGLE